MTNADEITPDGCSVEMYARMPDLGEARMLHELVPEGAVLDLGCGTGRITTPLAELGHRVVAVDESGAMLARIPAHPLIETVRSTIQELALDERFAVVLLAGNLINTDGDELRRALLATSHRHLAPGGVLLAQWRPPGWFNAGPGTNTIGRIAISRIETDLGNDRFAFSVDYRDGDDSWHHDYRFRRLSESDLRNMLTEAGFGFSRWTTDDQMWFMAVPST